MRKSCRCLILFVVALAAPVLGNARAQEAGPADPKPTVLPQDHEYQRVLRDFMAGLTDVDLAVEELRFTEAPAPTDDDALYRMWLLSLQTPGVGPSVAAPAAQFTLAGIETAEGVMRPAASPEALAWLADWDYPGNPYHGSRALKLRAFAFCALDMMMLDELHEKRPDSGANRSDFLGGTLIWLAYAYPIFRDALPVEAADAYEAGLAKLVRRLNQWGPRGAMTDMDLFAAVSMRYADRALNDPEITKIADAYSARLFSDPRFFHPSGYFVDSGSFDTAYNGISLNFASWAAMLDERPVVRDALDRACRLRAYLSLPEPDGQLFGPCHMSSRTSGGPPHDSWYSMDRRYAAPQITDEAACATRLPSREEMAGAAAKVVGALNGQLAKAKPRKAAAWKERHWVTRAVNFAAEYYRPGYYAHRAELQAENSPMLRLPFRREGTFVRAFADAFVIAKFDAYGVVVHTGPVGGEHTGWKRPYGFGGGALSAFWTPQAGSALLGRRRGVQGHDRYTKKRIYDRYDEWNSWPTHAASGLTPEGKLFTSARIRKPEVTMDIGEDRARVRVAGVMPKSNLAQGDVLKGDVAYERTFTVEPAGVRVETVLQGDGQDQAAELYEMLPVFLREQRRQADLTPTEISFRVGDEWKPATAELQRDVAAVRLARHEGAIVITFDESQCVRLSPEDWLDGYVSFAMCRNVLVDLLGGRAGPRPVERFAVAYTITPGTDE